jgi:hypothetical protein
MRQFDDLELADSAIHRIGQRSGDRGLDYGITALQPGAIDGLEARARTRGPTSASRSFGSSAAPAVSRDSRSPSTLPGGAATKATHGAPSVWMKLAA